MIKCYGASSSPARVGEMASRLLANVNIQTVPRAYRSKEAMVTGKVTGNRPFRARMGERLMQDGDIGENRAKQSTKQNRAKQNTKQ